MPQPSRLTQLRGLLALAGPIAVSQVAQNSMGFVDTVMVGRLGETDLAAVSLGAAVYFGILVFALGVQVGVGPVVAQAFGARDARAVGAFGRHGLLVAALLTPLVLAALYAVRLHVDRLIGDAAVAELAAGYLGAVSWSVLPYLGFVALRSWVEALNRPLVVTVLSIVTVGVNALGNYVLVYGHWGAPQLGAVGTGYATSISNAFLFVSLVAYVLSQRRLRQYDVFAFAKPVERERLRELLRVGGPIGLSFGIEVGLFSATALLVGRIGATELAAHQIAIQCASMAFMLPLSVALAATIRVGNLVGAGELAQARACGWLGIAFGTSLMIVSALGFVAYPDAIIALFLGEIDAAEAPVAEIATGLLVLAAAFQLVDGLQGTAAGALRGLKDTFAPMLIGLVSYWIVGLGSGVYLSETYGVRGLWTGLVIGIAAAAVLLVLRWWRRSRRLV